jgi:hypothetical protein
VANDEVMKSRARLVFMARKVIGVKQAASLLFVRKRKPCVI